MKLQARLEEVRPDRRPLHLAGRVSTRGLRPESSTPGWPPACRTTCTWTRTSSWPQTGCRWKKAYEMVMRGEIKGRQDHCRHPETESPAERGQAVNILYEDDALGWCWTNLQAVQRKRIPAALRRHPADPLGVRCTGWTPACPAWSCPHPAAAAGLEPTDHPSQEAYAVQDGRARGRARPCCRSITGRCFPAGQTTPCLRRGFPAGLAVQGRHQRPGVFDQPPHQRGVRGRAGMLHYLRQTQDACLAEITCTGPYSSDPGAICLPEASPVGRRLNTAAV